MSGVFIPRFDSLPSPQLKIWPELKGLARLGFVLYGGTGIALRLGHRASVDFDFFTDKALDRRALQRALPVLSRSTILQDEVDTVSALVRVAKAKVKVSFFAALRIGRVGKPDWTEDRVLQVASLQDLLATKLKVLLQRVEVKDYLDVAAILENGADLAAGLATARALYGVTFPPNECLKALVYFEGGDLSSLPGAVRTTLIEAVKAVDDLPKVRRSSRILGLATARRPRG
ncbi:MAG TPA: nucleotidyl transferase AbiEii/AbiGii toxin family protein [Dongiaceae bacterium]|nr:nucleotidyl transferase AbiEii/AbiGii toxin family protein [Dongiaceae bacterium]